MNLLRTTFNYGRQTFTLRRSSSSAEISEQPTHGARTAHQKVVFSESFRPTRNPIVLCHGLFGYDALFSGTPLQMRYWNKIEQALRQLGCEVHTGRVGTASSVKRRSEQLHQFMESKLAGRHINLLAHSMGGLDCRYLISHTPSTERSYRIESLTTIATPHHGSPFMDWVYILYQSARNCLALDILKTMPRGNGKTWCSLHSIS
jgi:triacylglycerol esterase/lipase EstA (alpha/beta hydrolase family)